MQVLIYRPSFFGAQLDVLDGHDQPVGDVEFTVFDHLDNVITIKSG